MGCWRKCSHQLELRFPSARWEHSASSASLHRVGCENAMQRTTELHNCRRSYSYCRVRETSPEVKQCATCAPVHGSPGSGSAPPNYEVVCPGGGPVLLPPLIPWTADQASTFVPLFKAGFPNCKANWGPATLEMNAKYVESGFIFQGFGREICLIYGINKRWCAGANLHTFTCIGVRNNFLLCLFLKKASGLSFSQLCKFQTKNLTSLGLSFLICEVSMAGGPMCGSVGPT